MIILVGASASGKTQIAKLLFSKGYQKCITTTTRPKRVGEVDGVDYHFISKQDFNDLLLKNAFLEVTKYQDNLYGLQRKDIIKDGIVIVDPSGANNIIAALGRDVFVAYIKSSTANRKKWMLVRGDDMEDIKKRLSSDNVVFRRRNLIKTDLIVHNKNQPVETLANFIHEHYLNYQKTTQLK